MAIISSNNTTVAFDNTDRFWKTRYSFWSSCYGWLNNILTSGKNAQDLGGQTDLVYRHNSSGAEINDFHGNGSVGSVVQVSFNDNVSANKIFKSISVEGTQNIENSISLVSVNSDNLPVKSFNFGTVKDKGGILYADMGKNIFGGSANVKCLGMITGVRPINPDSAIVPDEFLPDGYEHPLTNQISDADSEAFDADRYWAIKVQGGDLTAQSLPSWREVGSENKYHGGLYFVKEVGGGGDYVGDYNQMSQNLLTGLYSTLRDKNNANNLRFAADMQDIGRPSEPDTFDIPNHYAGEKILYTRTDFQFTNDQSFIETYFADDGSGDGTFNYQTKRYALYQVNENAIFGDEPRGQYCDLTIAFGSEKFEMYALNLNYEITNLDHSR